MSQLRVSFIDVYAQAIYLQSTILSKIGCPSRRASKNISVMVENGLVHSLEEQRIQMTRDELTSPKKKPIPDTNFVALGFSLEWRLSLFRLPFPKRSCKRRCGSHPQQNILAHQERAAQNAVNPLGGLFPTIGSLRHNENRGQAVDPISNLPAFIAGRFFLREQMV